MLSILLRKDLHLLDQSLPQLQVLFDPAELHLGVFQ